MDFGRDIFDSVCLYRRRASGVCCSGPDEEDDQTLLNGPGVYLWTYWIGGFARPKILPTMVLGSDRSGPFYLFISVWSANGHHAKSQPKIGKA